MEESIYPKIRMGNEGYYEHADSERANELKMQSLSQSYGITVVLHISLEHLGPQSSLTPCL